MTISVATYLCYMCEWYVDARPDPELAYVIQQLCGQYGSGCGGEIDSNQAQRMLCSCRTGYITGNPTVVNATGMSVLGLIPSWLMSSSNYAVSMAQAVEGRLTATKHKECSAHVALGT